MTENEENNRERQLFSNSACSEALWGKASEQFDCGRERKNNRKYIHYKAHAFFLYGSFPFLCACRFGVLSFSGVVNIAKGCLGKRSEARTRVVLWSFSWFSGGEREVASQFVVGTSGLLFWFLSWTTLPVGLWGRWSADISLLHRKRGRGRPPVCWAEQY